MQCYEPLKIFVSNSYDEVAELLDLMEEDCKFLPIGSLDQIEAFSNLAFFLVGEYEGREDLNDILTFAFRHKYKVFYIEYGEIINRQVH